MSDRRIRLLDDTLVDQIAAGEVVERPASAVKELLENSVDAGASRIDLEIEDGGKALIRVSDDGSGMGPEDAQLALQRHATSKIRSFDDLVRVRSLGFRGEALPSIASVSRFSLRTRPHDATRGTEVRVEGGAAPTVRPAGGAAGTTVEVRDLFFNVPARRKFSKASHAEAARVHDAFLRVALAHPEIRFTYRSGGREIRSLPPALGLPGRAAAIFQSESLEEIVQAERGLRFEAMLGAGDASKQSSRQLYLFVNGRAVIDSALVRAIVHGYGAELPPGRFPVGVVQVHLPPEEVDVNVHPRKTEVRLVNGPDRLRQIREVVAKKRASRVEGEGPISRAAAYWDERLGSARAVDRSSPMVREGGPAPSPLLSPLGAPERPGPEAARERRVAPPRDRWGVGSAIAGAEAPAEPHAGGSPSFAPKPEPAPAAAPARTRTRRLRYLGRAHGNHLVCESADGLTVIEGRRGLALLTTDRIRRALDAGPLPSRALVFPPRLEVRDAPGIAERESDRLARLGFEVGPLSPETLVVHAAPSALASLPAEEALRIALASGEDEALAALAEAEAEKSAIDDDVAHAIVAFVEALETLPPGLARALRLGGSDA